jgi:hypothetical protein
VPATLHQYFQQILPVAHCTAEDGRVVGHLLMDLVSKAPKDLAHGIREFANRSAMLRECGMRHIGDMLAAMLVANTHSDSEHDLDENATPDVPSVTAEQATAIGGMLAARTRSSPVPAMALRDTVDSHYILCTMKALHPWFVPMLEVLLVAPESTQRSISRRFTRRLSAIVAPLATPYIPPTTTFDSVVRPDPCSIPPPTSRSYLNRQRGWW